MTTRMAQKRKFEKFVDKEDNEEVAKLPKVITHLKKQEKRLIVVLEGANLEVSLYKKSVQKMFYSKSVQITKICSV